jgi:hypothetical protein
MKWHRPEIHLPSFLGFNMTDPIKCLGMKCLFLAAVTFFLGCERSSSKTGTAPPPNSSTKATEEQTTITPFPVPKTLFGNHDAFVFEVTGPPAIFALEAHWSPNPKGANLSDETLLYSTEKYLERHNVGVWEEKSEERGSVVVLFPKKPTETIELHFKRGDSGFKVDETLQSVLPEEAADMRATGVWVSFGGLVRVGMVVRVEVVAGEAKTKVVGMRAQKFESDDKTAWVVYRLTVTPAESSPQNAAR